MVALRRAKSATRSRAARSKAFTKTSASKFKASLERRKENSIIFFRALQKSRSRMQRHGRASSTRVSCMVPGISQRFLYKLQRFPSMSSASTGI